MFTERSIHSAIIVKRAERYPLLIDLQRQGKASTKTDER